MKFIYLVLLVSTVLMVSCGESNFEEGCEDLSVVLIGQWQSDEKPGSTVEFRSSSTLIDDDNFFGEITASSGQFIYKTFIVNGNEEIEFRYTFGLIGIVVKKGDVQKTTCNTFRIGIDGELLNFTKME